MYNGQTVSIVISTYREKNSIRNFIEECFQTVFVDEVIVVNNNAELGTDEQVNKTKAKIIYENKQGYGFGYRKGLAEATGELILMTEADGTFSPDDFEKLLIYSKNFPVVFCTRTATFTILNGANLGLFLKWGNWTVAKMIEVIFGATQLSDVGCTTRLIRKDVLGKIQPYFKVGGSHFGLEMILHVIQKNIPFIEIPIRYFPRIGESSVTGNFWKALKLGLTMILFIFKKRIFN